MAFLTRDEVRRRALQAASKVALTMSAASIFGACGGAMSSETPGATSDDAGPDQVTSDVAPKVADAAVDTAKPVPDAVVTATTCGPIVSDAATPEQLDCCAARVRETFPAEWAEPISEEPTDVHPELAECCAQIVEAYDGVHELGLTFQQARACCYVLPAPWYSHGGAACTPWGPPMPPAMPGATNETDGEEAFS
ncbi:MAG: hypothetical protein ABI175_21415 [Polyangiales bacterium]